jgi:hypothetical protein
MLEVNINSVAVEFSKRIINFYEKLLLIKEALFYGKMILSKVLDNVNKK